MSSRRFIFAVLALLCLSGAVHADESIQQLGRYWGFGWGDGYHANRTWAINGGPACHCRPVAPRQVKPAPTQKPADAPHNVEPSSPSDKPVLKTGRRYPTQSGQQRR